MLNNALKIFLRNLLRKKIFSFVNIIGLAIGISVFTLIIIYLLNETSYDKFHKNAKNIYKLTIGSNYSTVPPLANVLKSNFPEIEKVVRTSSDKTAYLQWNDKSSVKITNILYADTSFFQVFTFAPIYGVLENALKNPDAIILTKSSAFKMFGDENALERTIQYNSLFPSRKLNLTVKAVIEDLPSNSSFEFNGIISFLALNNIRPNNFNVDENWRDGYCNTFIQLKKNALFDDFDKKLKDFMPKLEEYIYGINPGSDNAKQRIAGLVPLNEVHFYNTNNKRLIRILFFIGLAILFLAIINYLNLTLARSADKLRQTGIRKLIGANRKNLLGYILLESIIYCLLAGFFAITIITILFPYFKILIEKDISLTLPGKFYLIIGIITVAIIIGIISAIYPGIKFTSHKPLNTFSYKTIKEKNFRYALITFQFAVSIVLICCILIFQKQFSYIKNKDLGFNNKQIVFASLNSNLYNRLEEFKQELLKNPNVQGISGSQNELGQICVTLTREINGSDRYFQALPVDADFIPTMGLNLVKGRNFSDEMKSDPYSTVILSETAVRAFDLEENDIIGTEIFMYDKPARVIGVVKDIYFQSFHNKLDPFVLFYHPGSIGIVNIRISNLNVSATLNFISNVWKKFSPDIPFEYQFLDESYNILYKSDRKFGQLIMISAALAIFIACLGLFGLTIYSAEQRTKEIGIRKVNGAGVAEVLILLNKNFIIWISVAFVMSTPIAYFAMNKWLENFAYKTELSWWVFAVAGGISMAIALLTVSFQTWQSASRNPVEALRYE